MEKENMKLQALRTARFSPRSKTIQVLIQVILARKFNQFCILFQGLNKDKDKSERKSDCKVTNSFWVYSINDDKWTCFYRNENNSSVYWNKMQTEEPRPRYAHQLVYDESNRVHFMFGGNPGGKQGM